MLEVTDDSGFLALVDPDAYAGFVGEDWELDQLMAHFRAAMGRRELLIWGTGLEGWWRVQIATAPSRAAAFRTIAGPIVSSAGRLLVTNYESLTMAAQVPDLALPEDHQEDLVVRVEPGTYACRVLQLFDPDEDYAAPGDGPDFVLEILPAADLPPAWSAIPWSDF